MAEHATDDPIEATINLESCDPEGTNHYSRVEPTRSIRKAARNCAPPKGETIYVLMQILQKADRYTHMWIAFLCRPEDEEALRADQPEYVARLLAARRIDFYSVPNSRIADYA